MFGCINLKISDICNCSYGKGNTIPKDGGIYPVYGCNGIVGSTSTYNNEDGPIIGHIGSAGTVVWGKGKHFVTYNGTICKAKETVLPKYLYYLLIHCNLNRLIKGSQPFLSFSDYSDMTVQLPHIEKQQEIVDILNDFEKVCNDLQEGIPAEINAVKQQYEYYRDNILNFTDLKIN